MRKIVERQTCDFCQAENYSDRTTAEVDGKQKQIGVTQKQIVVDDKAYLLDLCPDDMSKWDTLTVQQIRERGVQVPWKKNKVVVQGTPRNKKGSKKSAPKGDGKGENHRGKLPKPPITLGPDGKHHCPGCRGKYGTRRGLQKHWTQRVNQNALVAQEDAA